LYVCACVSVLEAWIIVCVVELRVFFALVVLYRIARDLAVCVLDGNVQERTRNNGCQDVDVGILPGVQTLRHGTRPGRRPPCDRRRVPAHKVARHALAGRRAGGRRAWPRPTMPRREPGGARQPDHGPLRESEGGVQDGAPGEARVVVPSCVVNASLAASSPEETTTAVVVPAGGSWRGRGRGQLGKACEPTI